MCIRDSHKGNKQLFFHTYKNLKISQKVVMLIRGKVEEHEKWHFSNS